MFYDKILIYHIKDILDHRGLYYINLADYEIYADEISAAVPRVLYILHPVFFFLPHSQHT